MVRLWPVDLAASIVERVINQAPVGDEELTEFAASLLEEQPFAGALEIAKGDGGEHRLHKAARLAVRVMKHSARTATGGTEEQNAEGER